MPGELVVLKCPACGGSLEVTGEADLFKCQYCSNLSLLRRAGAAVQALTLAPDFERPANLWRGKFLGLFPNAQGGKLGLTDREVVFVPHQVNAGPLSRCTLSLEQVRQVTTGPRSLTVEALDGERLEFVVSEPEQVQQVILERRDRLRQAS